MENVELKNYKLEYRVVSRLKALSGKSGPSRFHRRVQIQQFFYQDYKLK